VDGAADSGSDADISADVDDGSAIGGVDADSGSSGGSGPTGPYSLPAGYTKAELGGWKLGPPVTGNLADAGDECGAEIIGVVRDFKRGDDAGKTYQGQPLPTGHAERPSPSKATTICGCSSTASSLSIWLVCMPRRPDRSTSTRRPAALGITPGNNYELELFHAERGMTESHFRIDTTLKLTQCGEIVVK